MNNRTDFDVIIIGAGPSGIFCAYKLIKERPSLNILMVEKGRPIEKRVCPKRTTKVCVGCRPCSITTGFAGAGAFSDGKLSLSPDVGGNLPDILGYDKALELIHESDDIYLKFGADTNVYGVDKQKEIQEIRRRAIMANLKLIECPIRHLGTEEGYKIYTRLQEHLLSSGVRIEFNTMVQDILIEDGCARGILTDKGETYYAREIVSAIGREGSDWLLLANLVRRYTSFIPSESLLMMISLEAERSTTPAFFATTQTPESTAALASIPVPTTGASVESSGTA